jgi:hypothetical protein
MGGSIAGARSARPQAPVFLRLRRGLARGTVTRRYGRGRGGGERANHRAAIRLYAATVDWLCPTCTWIRHFPQGGVRGGSQSYLDTEIQGGTQDQTTHPPP